ncbi:MAG: hypothetical protein ACRD3T_20825, partial [Terriglobia bacterium]
MKYINYTKYIGDPFEDLTAEDLMQILQDYLLDSGFYNQFSNFYEMDPERTMEELERALLEAMQERGMIPPQLAQQMMEHPEDYRNSKLAELMRKLMERMAEE